MKLRPYQRAAIDSFLEASSRSIIQLPTGTGKTIVGLAAALEMGRTLWIAHRDELISQPMEKLRQINPNARAGVIKAEKNEIGAEDVVFASVQSLARPGRLSTTIDRWTSLGQPFDLVVIDEAHHAPADSYLRILNALTLAQPGYRLLGLTATPVRSDRLHLGNVFETICYQMSIVEAIDGGYCCPFTAQRYVLRDLHLPGLRQGGAFAQGELEDALVRAGAAEATAQAVVENCADRRTIVFTVTVDQATRTCEELVKRGVFARTLSHRTKKKERQQIIADFRSGKVQAIVNAMVLTEGFDGNEVSAVVVARPVAATNQGMYIQMVGRGLRPDTPDCLILDLVGAHEQHGVVVASDLLNEVDVRRQRAEKNGDPCCSETARVVTFLEQGTEGSPSKSFSSRPRRWLTVRRGRVYAIPLGADSALAVSKGEAGWDISSYSRHTIKNLDSGVDMTTAQLIGEEIARDLSSWLVTGLDVERSLQAATEDQSRALKDLGLSVPRHCTQGQAHGLLLAENIRRVLC
jgi:superfamily II DNA or RNA helicase